MDSKFVQFAVKDNNNYFKLELSKALLHLIEFDFTYFWERCIEAGRAAKKNGRLPQNTVSNAKNIIAGIHPYVEALINDDFSEIVTDCIIEYICHSERIGTEELWVRCISPKTLYEKAIFDRISEYKTGKAINEWNNIVKIQEYARNKVSFIYDCDGETVPQSEEILKARKEYFDLAYSVAANELGMTERNLPSVKVCSPSLMPNAPFMNSRVSKAIYRRFAEVLKLGGDMSVSESKDCTHIYDKMAMDAYDYVRGMNRPAEMDMKFVVEAFKNNSFEIYTPNSFKAAVDLEFDLMMKNGTVLRKCESCGRYFAADDESFFCQRVNSSGLTCRKQNDIMREAIAKAAGTEKRDETYSAEAETAAESEIKLHELPSFDEEKPEPKQVPPELEKRGQKVYNALYKRVGKGMDEKEFHEWSQYLSNMKRNIKSGESSIEQLEEFLDYSDKFCAEVKSAGKNKSAPKAEFHYPEKKNESAEPPAEKPEKPKKVKKKQETEPDPEMAHIHVPFIDEDEEIQTIKKVSGTEVEIKPFRPETFDSISDAIKADTNFDSEDDTAKKTQKKKSVIKEPQWKRMTREEAYRDLLTEEDEE